MSIYYFMYTLFSFLLRAREAQLGSITKCGQTYIKCIKQVVFDQCQQQTCFILCYRNFISRNNNIQLTLRIQEFCDIQGVSIISNIVFLCTSFRVSCQIYRYFNIVNSSSSIFNLFLTKNQTKVLNEK